MVTVRYPELIQHFPQSTQIFIKRISNRIDNGKNALVIVVGATGSGKSLSTVSLMIGIYLYRRGKMPSVETITDRCIFKAKNLLEKFNENTKLKNGTAWNWDEAGIDISHKTFMSVQNRVVGWLAQTFRNMRQIVFFTVPSASMIDATVRKLLHFYLETLSIDQSNKMCIIKPLELQYNTRYDKMYYHNLTYPSQDELIEVDVMGVPLPPPEYVKAYEEKKNKFTIDLNLELQQMLLTFEQRKGVKLTETQQKILDLLKEGETSTGVIAKKLKTRDSLISTNFGYMRNKGVDVDKYLKKRPISPISPKKPKKPNLIP